MSLLYDIALAATVGLACVGAAFILGMAWDALVRVPRMRRQNEQWEKESLARLGGKMEQIRNQTFGLVEIPRDFFETA